MSDTNRKAASTILREIGVQEEIVERGKNKWKEDSNEYGFTKVPEEIDGSLEERTKETVINYYDENKPYKNPDADSI